MEEREAESWREFWDIVGAEAYRIWTEDRAREGASAQESA